MNRVGGPVNTSLDSSGVSAVITGSSDTRLINSNNRISGNARDKNKIKGWNLIKEFSTRGTIYLPKTLQDEAKELFNLVESDDYFKGKRLYSKVASVIMIVTRKSKLPKNIKDIMNEYKIPKKELSRIYNAILKRICPTLKIGLKPSQCIPQILVSLGLQGPIEEKCRNVADYITTKEMLTGRNPYTLAGVAIYLVTQLTMDQKKSFKDIGVAVKLSHSTIRNAYKDLYEYRFEILDEVADSKEQIEELLPKP